MTTSAAQSSPAAAGDAKDSNLRCLCCAYDLRGLDAAGRCPECGAAIAAAYEARRVSRAPTPAPLALVPQAWLRRLSLACVLIVTCVLGVAVLTAIAAVVWSPPALAWYALTLPLTASLVIGMILLSTPEPNAPPARGRATRCVLRGAAVAIVASSLLGMIWQDGVYVAGSPQFWHGKAFIDSLVSVAATFVTWRHLARLMDRAPHPRIARVARAAAVYLPAMMLVQVVFFFHLVVAGDVWFVWPMPVAGAALPLLMVPLAFLTDRPTGVAAVAWIVFALSGAVATALLVRIADRLGRVAAETGGRSAG